MASIEDDLDERVHAAGRLGRQAAAALNVARQDLEDARGELASARRQLAAALAMTTREPCEGCHRGRAAAITAAQEAVRNAEVLVREAEVRTGLCEEAIRTSDALVRKLRYALARIRAVPADLGETYESVYALIRRGGYLPREGRWVTGASPSP